MSSAQHNGIGRGTYISWRSAYLYLLAFALVALCIVSLGIGRYSVPISTIVRILGALVWPSDAAPAGWTQNEWVVVTQIRLPRIIIAVISGMGLGLSGAVLQGLFRNPLVGPDIIGVSHGAAFGGVFAILLGASVLGIVSGAVIGGLLALGICFALAGASGNNILTLVLTGLIVSAFFGAAVGVIQYVADPDVQLPSIVYWLLGSFANANWSSVTTIVVPFFVAGTMLLMMSWRLNLLSLDDFDAMALGLNVARLRWLIVFLVTLIVASQVAVSGGIGWVGLIIPHFARMIFGADHRTLLPASALLGGIYVVAMDDIARTASNQEIPIGLLTALVGTPIFAWLLQKNRTRGWRSE